MINPVMQRTSFHSIIWTTNNNSNNNNNNDNDNNNNDNNDNNYEFIKRHFHL